MDRPRAGPDGWWREVNGDTAIGTQLDDGAIDLAAKTAADPAAVATSSSSAPHLVAELLDLLDAGAGHRVLEIGTGTGWTAALLAHSVGQENVTTIEIDAAVAARAVENLTAAGFAPRVIVGDGARGWEPDAPYDRVHVTAGVGDVRLARPSRQPALADMESGGPTPTIGVLHRLARALGAKLKVEFTDAA